MQSESVLFELVFDITLTDRSRENRPLYEFTLAHPGFRRRVQDVRFTRENAWLTILIEGEPAALDEYERRFGKGPGTLALEARRLGSGPGFRLAYEKQREPRGDDEETIWHLVALDVGTDARITYDTGLGRSRVAVVHEDRAALRRFYSTLVRLDEYGEVSFVRIQPVAAPDPPPVATDDLLLLRAAWTGGYYERPRRTTLRALGRKLGVPYTTLGWRLRGLETVALDALLRAHAAMVDEAKPPPRARKRVKSRRRSPRGP